MTNVLVVGAHPDDEVLGAGGTIARHVAAGDSVHLLLLADGEASRTESGREDQIAEQIRMRQGCARRAADVLGAASLEFGGFPDNRMDQVGLLDVTQRVEEAVGMYCPETVYTHHGGDLNIDHQVTRRSVMTACRPLPGGSVRRILSFEVLSSTEWGLPEYEMFRPTYFVDIEKFLETKMRAIECYDSELRDPPHPRSEDGINVLARMRGLSAGLSAAEAFVLERGIEG